MNHSHEVFIEILEKLAKIPNLKICGSYANETQHSLSDIDFVVTGRRSNDHLRKAIKILDELGVVWESGLIGQINTPRNMEYLTVPIEIMDYCWVRRTPNRKLSVIFYGIEFKTY